ncbi:MAG: hypothetical protein RJA81_615, partial [Planctomycetota bacterium]
LPFLEGPESSGFCSSGETNRSAHFAGGRLVYAFDQLRGDYAVSLWFWNGLSLDARPITGWLLSRDQSEGLGLEGDHVGLGGHENHPGRLVFQHGPDSQENQLHAGKTEIPRWTWNELQVVRSGDRVRIYLNGAKEPEIDVKAAVKHPELLQKFWFGGRSDSQSTWEGRLDEIAVFPK